MAGGWLLIGMSSPSARAQVELETIPQTGLPAPEEPAPSQPPYDFAHNVTGDWLGARTWLADRGIEITGGYAMEFMANPIGGDEQGQTYVHNILLRGDFNLEKLLGVPNTTFRIAGSQRTGNSLTNEYIHNAISVQQLYGGGERVRLVEAQFITSLFDDRLNLAYGRLAATDDFLTSPLYCQFVNNGICGQPPAPFFNLPNGITAYPTAVWGARAKVKPTPETYLMVGVYDGDVSQANNAGTDNNKHGTNFTFGDNGVLILTELAWTPKEALLDLPAHYKIGGYYHTGHFRDVAKDVDGGNLFVSGLPGDRFSGNSGFYLLLDQMVYRERPDSNRNLTGFVVGVASPDQDHNVMPYYVSGGLVYEGLIGARPYDKTSFGVTNAWFSNEYSDARNDAGLERRSHETALELNHQFQITPAVYFRPDLQYIIRPYGQKDIDNAFVVGFEAGLVF